MIVARTLSDRVFEIVRERVISGELRANAPIRQDALAAELGVSKIPLREALARLEQSGLLSSQANRGYAVRAMSVEQADEIYALRLSIEPEAAARGAEQADEDDRARVRDAARALEEATTGDRSSIGHRRRGFDLALVAPCRRDLTIRVVEWLGIMSERYLVAHPSRGTGGDHPSHDELVDAWLARDGAAVERLLRQRLEATTAELRRRLSAQEG